MSASLIFFFFLVLLWSCESITWRKVPTGNGDVGMYTRSTRMSNVHTESRNAERDNSNDEEGIVMFEHQLQHIRKTSKSKPKQEKPKHEICEFGICEEVVDYPTNEIQEALKNSKWARDFFEGRVSSVDFQNRDNFDDKERLCKTRPQQKFPKKAKNLQNVEKLIVNVESAQQDLLIEVCEKENSTCGYNELFPMTLKTSCIQKHIITRMMTYDSSTQEKLGLDNFLMPSCCVCVVEKI